MVDTVHFELFSETGCLLENITLLKIVHKTDRVDCIFSVLRLPGNKSTV